jgi:hypothetical protein
MRKTINSTYDGFAPVWPVVSRLLLEHGLLDELLSRPS